MSIRFGVLGAGRIGRVHAEAVATVRGAHLVAVADPVPAAAEAVEARHGCDVRTIDEIAGSGDIDAVVICTPTDTHADLIEQFVKAGKAVFCEKPIDLDIARVEACLAVVAQAGGTLMLGFQRRFDPDFRALKAEIENGAIGEVEMIALTSRDPAPPPVSYIKRSGGIFRDMAIHDFDVARWLMGEEFESVMAAGSVLVAPEIGAAGDYDSVNVILRTASGRQCTISCSRRAGYGYDQRIEVLGALGAVTAQNTHRAKIEVATSAGYTRPPLVDFFMERYMGAYTAEIAAFVACLRDGTPVPTTGHDGLMALALAEAAQRSAETGRAVRVADVSGGA